MRSFFRSPGRITQTNNFETNLTGAKEIEHPCTGDIPCPESSWSQCPRKKQKGQEIEDLADDISGKQRKKVSRQLPPNAHENLAVAFTVKNTPIRLMR